jgi:hypothetical protein
VDVMRLSRIALSNLEKEGDGSDYAAAEVTPGDIRIENADAELDFDEQKEDCEWCKRLELSLSYLCSGPYSPCSLLLPLRDWQPLQRRRSRSRPRRATTGL